MFFHTMKYMFLSLIRNKNSMGWCFAFPLLLGTMFSFAFGGLGKDEAFSPIPVAVVMEEPKIDADTAALMARTAASYGFPIDAASISDPATGIRALFDTLSPPGEDQFLEVTYTSKEDAMALLEQKKIYGILQVDIPDISAYISGAADAALPDALLHLTVSAEMASDPLYQSILSSFVGQFNLEYHTICDIAMTDPASLAQSLEAMKPNTDYLAEESLNANSLDESSVYFFNLISMTCLFAAMAGSNVAIANQANLSTLGARKNVSPRHRLITILGELSATLLYEFITLLVALLYYSLVLGIDFGSERSFVALTVLCGCLAGISLGFFVGSIGHFQQETKFGFLMAAIMISCFLSGLMVGNMRMIVEGICPLLNRINPAALIADALYALAIYPSHERFFLNITSLLLFSAACTLGGFAMVRREKYASL